MAAGVKTTALAILPPEETWGPVQEIRQKHDKQVKVWPPHMNVFYPFVAEEHFVPFTRALAKTTEDLTIPRVTFPRKCNFGMTCCLEPESKEDPSLKKLHAACVAAAKEFKTVFTPDSREFHPHLTVGQFTMSRALEAFKKEACPPLEFEIGSLCLLARESMDDPFQVVYRVHLGKASRLRDVEVGNAVPYFVAPPFSASQQAIISAAAEAARTPKAAPSLDEVRAAAMRVLSAKVVTYLAKLAADERPSKHAALVNVIKRCGVRLRAYILKPMEVAELLHEQGHGSVSAALLAVLKTWAVPPSAVGAASVKEYASDAQRIGRRLRAVPQGQTSLDFVASYLCNQAYVQLTFAPEEIAQFLVSKAFVRFPDGQENGVAAYRLVSGLSSAMKHCALRRWQRFQRRSLGTRKPRKGRSRGKWCLDNVDGIVQASDNAIFEPLGPPVRPKSLPKAVLAVAAARHDAAVRALGA